MSTREGIYGVELGSVKAGSGVGERRARYRAGEGKARKVPEWGRPGTRRTFPVTQARAGALRQRMTPAEERLWTMLRRKRLAGLRFRRQHPIGPFIADFYCAQCHLIVEVDGPYHQLAEQRDRDARRTWVLMDRGIRVLRFQNWEVERGLNKVLAEIARVAREAIQDGE